MMVLLLETVTKGSLASHFCISNLPVNDLISNAQCTNTRCFNLLTKTSVSDVAGIVC